MEKLFTLDPHGSITLEINTRESEGLPIGNQLFRLGDPGDIESRIEITGEELTSLATQWLKYAREKGDTA